MSQSKTTSASLTSCISALATISTPSVVSARSRMKRSFRRAAAVPPVFAGSRPGAAVKPRGWWPTNRNASDTAPSMTSSMSTYWSSSSSPLIRTVPLRALRPAAWPPLRVMSNRLMSKRMVAATARALGMGAR